MSDVQAKLVWNGGQRFTGTNSAGITSEIDGDHKVAASPVELLLESIGSCAAVDVVLILDKMRTPASHLEVGLDADRHSPEPRYLTRTRLRFDIWGEGIKPEKAARAIQLSLVRYCSVFNSLRADMITEVEFRLHQPDADALGDYKAVTIGVAE